MIDIRHGDCIAEMRAMDDACVDAIVTDPPYELGFMGKSWDATGIANSVEMWREAYRVLKPGGHMLAFSGTRTQHRMVCAIEDAGFEIRDQIMWLYAQGFPKAEQWTQDKVDKGNVESAQMVAAGYEGWARGGLKPAHEPIVVARRPLIGTVAQNVLTHGTGALNIDGSRVGTDESTKRGSCQQMFSKGGVRDDTGRPAANRGETGSDNGRWPANVIHDGSPEVLEAFAAFGERKGGGHTRSNNTSLGSSSGGIYGKAGGFVGAGHEDQGTAARFFYSAKASAKDRAGSKHPTVKPISLMRYLCKLVTPPGGTVLDMFAGSGTTLQAALEEGFSAIGIEQDATYVNDIRNRISAAREGLGLFAVAAE
jgi:DNA modification methylase